MYSSTEHLCLFSAISYSFQSCHPSLHAKLQADLEPFCSVYILKSCKLFLFVSRKDVQHVRHGGLRKVRKAQALFHSGDTSSSRALREWHCNPPPTPPCVVQAELCFVSGTKETFNNGAGVRWGQEWWSGQGLSYRSSSFWTDDWSVILACNAHFSWSEVTGQDSKRILSNLSLGRLEI